MDSAMRDLDQLREREDGGASGRKAALLGLAGITTVGVVLALCVQVGTGTAEDAEASADPLARLAPGRPVDCLVRHADGTREALRLRHTCSSDHIGWFPAGSALNAALGGR